jgi:hypothetical protein
VEKGLIPHSLNSQNGDGHITPRKLQEDIAVKNILEKPKEAGSKKEEKNTQN